MFYKVVGGRFDDKGGKPSGYIRKLFEAMQAIEPDGDLVNGGHFRDLKNLAFSVGINQSCKVYGARVIFWFPDVPNDKEKLVKSLKTRFPRCYLITSKNNRNEKYSVGALVARALSVKANLTLEYKGLDTITCSIYDPLGNCFLHKSPDIDAVAAHLLCRVRELTRFTRMRSHQEKGPSPEMPSMPAEYFDLLQGYAKTFHTLIHGANQDRFLGNVSFRCERGFPSMRGEDDYVWVSRRNVDKRHIGPEGFVPVKLFRDIYYWGEHKPSVDTPIQLMLYRYYPNVNFMLHSHTYIYGQTDQWFTDNVIPCGALEEFYDIIQKHPNRDTKGFMINLRGHGSLVLTSKWEDLKDIPYVGREIPTMHP